MEYWASIIRDLPVVGEDENNNAIHIFERLLSDYYWKDPVNCSDITILLGPDGLHDANARNVANELFSAVLAKYHSRNTTEQGALETTAFAYFSNGSDDIFAGVTLPLSDDNDSNPEYLLTYDATPNSFPGFSYWEAIFLARGVLRQFTLEFPSVTVSLRDADEDWEEIIRDEKEAEDNLALYIPNYVRKVWNDIKNSEIPIRTINETILSYINMENRVFHKTALTRLLCLTVQAQSDIRHGIREFFMGSRYLTHESPVTTLLDVINIVDKHGWPEYEEKSELSIRQVFFARIAEIQMSDGNPPDDPIRRRNKRNQPIFSETWQMGCRKIAPIVAPPRVF